MTDTVSQTLARLQPALGTLEDPHYLIGASAMILAGVPIATTYDIDLLTSGRDALRLEKCWASHRLPSYTPEHPEKFRSQFGRYGFGQMDVEVMGDLEVFNSGKWERLIVQETVPHKDSTLLLPTLAEHLRILAIFGRPKDGRRAQLIRELLNSRM